MLYAITQLSMNATTSRFPLSLYRSIMKVHKRKLPTKEMRELGSPPVYTRFYLEHDIDLSPYDIQLGDSYVRNEFKLHKNVTNPDNLDKFFKEWSWYLKEMAAAPVIGGGDVIGRDLREDEISKLTTEQREKLEELHRETVANRRPQP